MWYEAPLIYLSKALKLRKVGDHHRRIDDTELGSHADLRSRQRAADRADIPLLRVAHVGKRAVAETAADDELMRSLGQQSAVQDRSDPHEQRLGVDLAKTGQQEIPKPQVEVVTEISVLGFPIIRLHDRLRLHCEAT